MKQALSFDETLIASLRSNVTVSKWDEAVEAYDQGKYKEAIHLLIDYVGVDIRKKYGNENGTYFKIPHGSIVVEIEITEKDLIVKVPFIELGEKHRVPILRKIAEVNFSLLNLSQIKLNDNLLNFQYKAPLELCEPLKIYYVMEEICHNADDLDDELVDLFGVKLIHEPQISSYDQSFLDQAWEKYNAYLKEADDYINYFQEKRAEILNWTVINITLKRIEYFMAPSGKLRTDIASQINDLYSQQDPQLRIQRGEKFLNELKQKSKEEVLSNLYKVETFMPIKSRSTLEGIQQNWQQPFEDATKDIQSKQYTNASLSLLLSFYDLFYYSNVNDQVSDKLTAVLTDAAGKDWNQAATILYDGMKSILNNELKVSAFGALKSSFLSKLFK